jgi:hypothetical protein
VLVSRFVCVCVCIHTLDRVVLLCSSVVSQTRLCICLLHHYFNLISTKLLMKMDILTGDEVWIAWLQVQVVEDKSKALQVL